MKILIKYNLLFLAIALIIIGLSTIQDKLKIIELEKKVEGVYERNLY